MIEDLSKMGLTAFTWVGERGRALCYVCERVIQNTYRFDVRVRPGHRLADERKTHAGCLHAGLPNNDLSVRRLARWLANPMLSIDEAIVLTECRRKVAPAPA